MTRFTFDDVRTAHDKLIGHESTDNAPARLPGGVRCPDKEEKVTIGAMTMNDYEGVYSLWISTPGMGLNNLDDSREGIEKYLKRNPSTCFVARRGRKNHRCNPQAGTMAAGIIHHTAVALDERNREREESSSAGHWKPCAGKGYTKSRSSCSERTKSATRSGRSWDSARDAIWCTEIKLYLKRICENRHMRRGKERK